MNALEAIDGLKEELDNLRPLPGTVLGQVEQKLRLEANYHSNAIEGNTLTLGETRSLILHGLTARGKPMRDHLDIEGHDDAVKAIGDAIEEDYALNEVFIRNLHRILLKEPYEADAMTPDGRLVKRTITIGDYKTRPNNVRTSIGEIYYFTAPEHVKPAMSDLIDWYRAKEQEGEHPIIIAATFHYRFVRIHPFDDGNGRMARLLMNMILIKHGYTVALIRHENRGEYLRELEQVDKTEDLTEFINYVATCCEYSLNLHLRAARGEPIEDADDIDREIALFKRSLLNAAGETLPAREYIESVLRPFIEYCQSKTELFSDVFGEVRSSMTLRTTAIDGQVITLCQDSATLPSFSVDVAMLDRVRSLYFGSLIRLVSFQGRSAGVEIAIGNNVDAHNCRWTFASIYLQTRIDYDGRDLEDLKKHFNELLRKMMDNLKNGGQ